LFGDLGVAVADGRIPNDYDQQLFLTEADGSAPQAITRDWDPSVSGAVWTHDGDLLVWAEDTDRVKLYRYDVEGGQFSDLDARMDSVSSVAHARQANVYAWYGSSATVPHQAWVSVDGTVRPLLQPGADRYAQVEIARVEDFDVTREDGTTLTGRVHYPPSYDPDKSYPTIVYYYGGTSPVSRRFGGRYPHQLWAANGYLVYVPQPRGATGFGQEVAADHVNDWGEMSGEDVIMGTEAFLAAHPAADAGRVGCIGASYGGFLTMSLVTKTDLFSAAAAHAGISTLPSYWGEGFWGHLYSAVASADSYPWNNRELYVDHSPLFSADQINTPLLLLHGAGDTNVPPGESTQMYVALKVLGKDVEYVSIDDENHWILQYEKRKKWSQTILAWFDWKLKEQPAWWQDLYPE
jgi:dipeptidyl aminopeptidase/acylaminoacyl peptidase